MKYSYLFLITAIVGGACSDGIKNENATKFIIPNGMSTRAYDSRENYSYAFQKSDGKITIEGDLKDGLKHGSWMSYDQNGAALSIETYNEGLLQGVSLKFDKQGYVEMKAYFHADNLQGEYLIFKRNKIVERRNYEAGILSGMLTKYYDSGKLMQEVPYVEGKIDGIGKWYDQERNMTIAYRYEKGELVDKNPDLDE